MCLMSVVLPAPFSPTRPTTVPVGTRKLTSSSANFSPNRRETFLISTIAGVSGEPFNSPLQYELLIATMFLSP